MGGGSELRTGLTYRDFWVSLTIWVWVDFMVWRSEGASREGPGGGGTMFAVCRVMMVFHLAFWLGEGGVVEVVVVGVRRIVELDKGLGGEQGIMVVDGEGGGFMVE
jgi:hypothetical protein